METLSQNKLLFSIVIPSWNNLPYLQNCIQSIRNHSQVPHQIIVHINEGTDGTLDWIRQQKDIDYTYSETNIGVCYALNKARVLVHNKYLLYLNDDMYLCPGWDTALMNEIVQIGHDYFFLSSTVIEPVASSNCVIEKNYGTEIETFNEAQLLKEFSAHDKFDWHGATWPPNILPVQLWDYVGGYSTEFSPGMYSDPDFSMKLWNAGVRYFKGVSASRAYHFGSKSVKRIQKNKGYYQFINKWGFASSVLTKQMLHRGEKFNGPLPEYSMNATMQLKKQFNKLCAFLFR
jgi:glycosyltransferase involved in cell wall biosynthesis